MRLALTEAGEYTLKLDDLQNISSSVCLFIEDTETGDIYPVSEDTEITVIAPEDYYITEKYVLHARPGATLESQMASCYGIKDGEITVDAPAYSDWTIQIFDDQNNLIESTEANQTSIEGLYAGTYTAVMTGDDTTCNSLTQQIDVTQPAQEVIEYTAYTASCSNEDGFLNVYVSNANEWTVAAFDEGQIVTENSGSDLVQLNQLPGKIYTVQISTECSYEEVVVDLSDTNAVLADFTSEEEIILENGIASLEAINMSQNDIYNEWYVNDELVSLADDFTFEFSALGEYELTLISSNDHCSSETTKFITVSAVDNVIENEISISILNTESAWLINGTNQQDLRIELYDTAGKLVVSERISNDGHSISKNGLSQGVYTLRILSSDSVIFNQKIAK